MINYIKNNKMKATAVIVAFLIFVVGIVITVLNSGSTYAVTYGCYKCGSGNYFWGSDYNASSCDYFPQYTSEKQCEDNNTDTTYYTVSYNANGGSGAPSSYTTGYGNWITLSTTKPTKTGYKFLGWSTSSTATTAQYSAGGSFMVTGNVTLYAVWGVEYACYKCSGGYVWGNSYNQSSCDLASEYTTEYACETQNKACYKCSGGYVWGNSYNQSSCDLASEYTTEYACETQNKACYKCSGGYVWGNSYNQSSCDLASQYTTESSCEANNSSPGDGTGSDSNGDSGTTNTNKLYITYYANGGTVTASTNGGSWTVKDDLIYLNSEIFVTDGTYGGNISGDALADYNNSNFLNITKSGYTAVSGAEWKCTSGCTTSGKTFDQSKTYKVSDFCDASNGTCSVQLSVNWKANSSSGNDSSTTSYTVSYDANGGSGAPASQTATSGSSITISTTKPTKVGYTFTEWNTKKDGTGTKIGNTYTVSGDITLYAQYKANEYKISYTLNGGSVTGNPSSATYDQSVTIKAPTKTITVVGNVNDTDATVGKIDAVIQKFTGWTSSTINTSTAYYESTKWSDGNTKVTATSFKNLTPTSGGTVTMVANWTPVELTLPTVTKVGYTCNWNTNSDGKGTSYPSGGKYTPSANSNSSVNMYAICKANSKADEEITTNSKTGDILIVLAWLVGIGALGYGVYYYRSRKIDV